MPPLQEVGVDVPRGGALDFAVDVVPRLAGAARLLGNGRDVAVLEVALADSVHRSENKKGEVNLEGF